MGHSLLKPFHGIHHEPCVLVHFRPILFYFYMPDHIMHYSRSSRPPSSSKGNGLVTGGHCSIFELVKINSAMHSFTIPLPFSNKGD